MAIQPPPQVEPVKRPHFVHPHECVELRRGSVRQLVRFRVELMHGANHNDPAAWAPMMWEERRTRR